MRELAPGLWHWQAPHPDWQRTEPWDQKDSSYAINDGERLLLFDPLAVPSSLLELASDLMQKYGITERPSRRHSPFPHRLRRRRGRVPRGRRARAARADVPEPPANARCEDLDDRTKLTQTMRFDTTADRDTTMQYGVEDGARARLR
jgi:hypothetical protein